MSVGLRLIGIAVVVAVLTVLVNIGASWLRGDYKKHIPAEHASVPEQIEQWYKYYGNEGGDEQDIDQQEQAG